MSKFILNIFSLLHSSLLDKSFYKSFQPSFKKNEDEKKLRIEFSNQAISALALTFLFSLVASKKSFSFNKADPQKSSDFNFSDNFQTGVRTYGTAFTLHEPSSLILNINAAQAVGIEITDNLKTEFLNAVETINPFSKILLAASDKIRTQYKNHLASAKLAISLFQTKTLIKLDEFIKLSFKASSGVQKVLLDASSKVRRDHFLNLWKKNVFQVAISKEHVVAKSKDQIALEREIDTYNALGEILDDSLRKNWMKRAFNALEKINEHCKPKLTKFFYVQNHDTFFNYCRKSQMASCSNSFPEAQKDWYYPLNYYPRKILHHCLAQNDMRCAFKVVERITSPMSDLEKMQKHCEYQKDWACVLEVISKINRYLASIKLQNKAVPKPKASLFDSVRHFFGY